MIYCANCGTSLSDDSKFCSDCGTSVTQVITPVSTAKSEISQVNNFVDPLPKVEPAYEAMPPVEENITSAGKNTIYCRNCGNTLTPNAFACTKCGLPPFKGKNNCQCCGASTHPEAGICIKCGVLLETHVDKIIKEPAPTSIMHHQAPQQITPPIPLTTYTQQNITVISKQKSVGTAFLLAFLFGPLGLLYASVTGGVIMIVASIFIGAVTLGAGLILTWVVSIIWAVIAAGNANNKVPGR